MHGPGEDKNRKVEHRQDNDVRVDPDKRAYAQQITKWRKRLYDGDEITGNKQSLKEVLIDCYDSSMMSCDKEINGNTYVLKDKRETHESTSGVPSGLRRN